MDTKSEIEWSHSIGKDTAVLLSNVPQKLGQVDGRFANSSIIDYFATFVAKIFETHIFTSIFANDLAGPFYLL